MLGGDMLTFGDANAVAYAPRGRCARGFASHQPIGECDARLVHASHFQPVLIGDEEAALA